MADLATTQGMAEGLSKQGLYFIAALSWTVSLALFLWLMRVTKLRVDDRDRLEEKFDAERRRMGVHMDQCSNAMEALAMTLAQYKISVRRVTGEVPQLGAEPPSQAKKLP